MGYSMLPSKGCSACRTRKIKCDQDPDGCSQCAKAHKECPGYRDLLSLMFRHESDSTAKKVEAREANTRKSKPKVKKQASSDKGKGKDKSPASTPAARTLSWVTATTSETGSTMTVASRRQKFNQSMSPLGSGTTYSLPSRAPSPISYSLGSGATLDERGICFFLQRFVIDMSGFTFSTLRTPLIGSAHMAAGDNSPLILSIKAVGLACLSNINSSGSPMPRLMTTTALQHYAAALRLVNDALRSPREAVKDSTLLTIMILGLWEQVTGRNNYSLSAWKNHVTGASALLKLRGRRQFKSPAGLQLFMQSSAMIMSSCVQHELNVPQHIIDLRAYASMFINTSDIGWRLNEITIKFANFRANLKNRHPSLSTPQQIIATCLEIDKEFEETFDLKTVPKEWRYETVYTGPEVDPRLVFAGYYHVYSNIRIARTWSAMRCSRFLLNGVISRLLGKGVSGHLLTELSTGMICQNFGFQVLDELEMEGGGLDQWTKSMEVLWKLQADIMAAVPQLVGYIPSPSGFAIASTDGGETDELLAYDPGSPPRAEALLATSNVRLSSPSVNPTDDEYNLISSSSRFTTYTDNIDPALISYPSSQHSPSSDSSPQNSRSSRSPTPSSAAALASAHNLPTLLVGCGGLFVLFPLYVIGVRGIASESLRTWIITCLKTIGRSQGLNQAIMLAGLLEKREQIVDWQRRYLKIDEQERNEGRPPGSLGEIGVGVGRKGDKDGMWKYGGEEAGRSAFGHLENEVTELTEGEENASQHLDGMSEFRIEGLTETGPKDEYHEMDQFFEGVDMDLFRMTRPS